MFLLKQIKSLVDTWGLTKSAIALPMAENDNDAILMQNANKVLGYVFAVEAGAVYCAIVSTYLLTYLNKKVEHSVNFNIFTDSSS